MSKAYSRDLRIRVLKAVDEGGTKLSVCQRFGICEKTVYLWLKQRKERGHIEPITKYQKGHSHKIVDLEKFKEFAIEHACLTTSHMAKEWGNVCASTISCALRKINFTRKKRPMVTLTAVKKSAQYLEKP